MLVLESNNEHCIKIANNLMWMAEKSAAKIDHYMWNSKTEGIIDLSKRFPTDLLIYGKEANLTECSLLFGKAPCVYIGEHLEDSPYHADFVIGTSDTKDSFILDKNTINNLEMPSFQKPDDPKGICVFTDTWNQEFINEHKKLVQFICKQKNVRLFGNNKIDLINYLGVIDDFKKQEIINQSQVCIDVDATSHHLCNYHDTPYLTKEEGHGDCFFSTQKELKEKIDLLTSTDKQLLTPKKYTFITNTYLDIMSAVFRHFGDLKTAGLMVNIRKDMYAWHINRYNR